MASPQELKDIMMAVESSTLFRSALEAMLDKASAESGIKLEPGERRAFRLSVATIEDDDDGKSYQFYNICASKGCTVVKGKKKAKKPIII